MFAKVSFSFPRKYLFVIVCSLLLLLSLLTIYQTAKVLSDQKQAASKAREQDKLVASLSARANSLEVDYRAIAGDDAHSQLNTINQVIEKYNTVKDKSATYKSQGVDTSSVDSQFPNVVDEILKAKYKDADTLLTTLDNNLETLLQQKQVADSAAKKVTTTTYTSTCSTIPASGYCRTSVNGFTVDVVTASLSSISVITDTANSSDCANNCPTKSLQSYVNDNGGYAGINGTYFCPADYASCTGKVASYDFPVYNSNLKKWLNWGNILWDNRAMMAFTSSGAVFYEQANSYSTLSGLKAAIVNYPGLVKDGVNIVSHYSLTSAQQTKGYRGGVGVKGGTVYLVIARSASVNDLANVMASLGVTNALNLDGGGSSALYFNGSYKVGPGRSLPNALVLK